MATASGSSARIVVPRPGIERRVDAARDRPGRVDALPGDPLDDLLAEPAQGDAVTDDVRPLLEEAHDVPARRVRIHAQEQVGRREVEEREGVRLHDLGAMEQLAKLRGGRRDTHGHDGVAGLRRGEEVADRADAADARRDGGHLVVGPSLDEALEASDLRDMELRVCHLPGIVEGDRDGGMPLDARDVVDGDGAHEPVPSPPIRIGSVG